MNRNSIFSYLALVLFLLPHQLLSQSECPVTAFIAYPVECSDNGNQLDIFVDATFEEGVNLPVELYIDDNLQGIYPPADFPLFLEAIDYPYRQLEVKIYIESLDCSNTVFVEGVNDTNLSCVPTCLDFEELEIGTRFGIDNDNSPGDTILSYDDLHITVENFFYFDGSFDFWNVTVDEGFFGIPIAEWGNGLIPSNINLNFDFSAVFGTVSNVCLDFYDGGGEVNLGVNGGTIQVLNDLEDVDLTLLPASVQVDLFPIDNPAPNFPRGKLCLTGAIEEFTIGGQEFVIDNVCYNEEFPTCEVIEFTAQPLACENDSFLIDLAFNISTPGNNGFMVQANNRLFGPFEYSTSNVQLGPLAGSSNGQYVVFAYDTDNESCGGKLHIGGVDCENTDCRIENLTGYFTGCAEDTSQSVQLTFDFFNAPSTGFDVFINGSFYEYFPPSENGFIAFDGIFQEPGTGGINIQLCNESLPDCCSEIFLPWVDCNPNGCMGFEYFTQAFAGSDQDAPGEVVYTENDIPLALTSFQRPNGSEEYDLALVSLAEFYPEYLGGVGRFVFFVGIAGTFDFDQPAATTTEVSMDFYYTGGAVNFRANDGELVVLSALENTTYTLPASNGQVELEVIFENDSSGQLLFSGAIETLTIGGQSLGVDNICTTVSEECELGDIQLDFVCQDDELYDLIINFDYQNVSEQFILNGPGNFSGTYNYTDLPIVLPDLAWDPTVIWEQVLVTDLDFDSPGALDCTTSIVYNAPCPIGLECAINNLSATTECTGEGLFITYSFEPNEGGPEGYSVFAYGQLLYSGPYSNSTTNTVGPITFSAVDELILVIQDNSFNNCSAAANLGIVCSTEACEIGGIDFNYIECLGPFGEYEIDFDFESVNAGETFTVTNLDGDVRTINQNGPYTLQFFRSPNQFFDQLTICSEASPNCCFTFDFDLPCTYECDISNIEVYSISCEAFGEYFFTLEFDGDPSALYNVSNSIGETYILSPGTHGLFFINTGNFVDQISICKADDPNCCETVDIEIPCPPCFIGDIEVTQVCLPNGGYNLIIDFDHQFTTGEFSIYFDDEFLGFFNSSLLPATIGPISEYPENSHSIRIDDQYGFCSNSTLYTPFVCTDCPNFEVNVEAFCEDNLLFATFELTTNQTITGGYKILIGNDTYGPFTYNTTSITTGPLFSFNSGVIEYVIVDADQPDCRYEDAFVVPVDCYCPIIDVFGETYCSDNGGLFLDIFVVYNDNLGSNGYYVFVDGIEYGPFVYDGSVPTIGPLPANNTGTLDIIVTDISFPDCVLLTTADVIDCTNDCNFNGLSVQTSDCDGENFSVSIDFEAENPGPLGYFVFVNGEINGPFSYSNTPITLGPFVGDGSTEYDFLLLDVADPSCFAYAEIGAVTCDPNQCQVNALVVQAEECSEDGFFMVDLLVEQQNGGAGGYTVVGNGDNYGSFSYEETFITLGPFEGDGATIYEFIIIDNSDPSCTALGEIGPIDCPGPCIIPQAEISTTINCNSEEAVYELLLDFDASNADGIGFDITFTGGETAFYLYEALPVSLTLPIPTDGQSSFTICENDRADCCQDVIVNVPCCSLLGLDVELGECQEDGTFTVELNVEAIGVGNTFNLVYGPQGGELEVATFSYEELPITLEGLDGSMLSDWFFQVTDESLFCQAIATVEEVYCGNDACVEFEDFETSFYGSSTGYFDDDVIGEEDGILLSYQNEEEDDCENCYLFMLNSTTYPQFSAGTGQIVTISQSGIGFDFTALPEQVVAVTLDYYHANGSFSVSVNGSDLITVGNPSELPSMIAPGISVVVNAGTPDANGGTLEFTGTIETLALYGDLLLLDNICTETETMENEEEVWPGDANADNLAHHVDLLNIGLAFGSQGPTREEDSNEWDSFISAPWEESFANGVNYKHADCNGDGIVDEADIAAIEQNYNRTHGPIQPIDALPGTAIDPPVFVDFPDQLPSGSSFEVPIVLGSEDLPMENIYGIAFTITFDPDLVDPNGLTIEYPASWFGEPNINMITLDKVFEGGRIEMALVRTDQNEVSGHGPIATIKGIIDDIAGVTSSQTLITDIYAIDNNEARIPVFNPEREILVGIPPKEADIDPTALIFPNPTSGEVFLKVPRGALVQQIEVYDLDSHLVLPPVANVTEFNIASLPTGVYVVKVKVDGLIYRTKLVKI
ncbi:MAG: T9SS type A sorting domain-containing protein [Bacteroidota bacterium]